MALLFGCRHPDQDHLYRNETEAAKNAGALTHAYTAYSRIPGAKKVLGSFVFRDRPGFDLPGIDS